MEMDQRLAFRHLTKRIAIDQQPLSYRVASRELGITIQQAKSLLAAFLDDASTRARGITATYCLCGQITAQPKKEEDDAAMDLDSQDASQKESTPLKSIILLVPQAELDLAQKRFVIPPRSHIYALHSTPLASTSDLSLHTLPLLSTEAHQAKWKPIPLGGYGEIVHPNGERKKSSSQTGKKVFANKGSTSSKPTVGGKGDSTKALTSTTDSKALTSTTTSTKKASTSTVRKIGQPGGLFARREPTPPPVAPKVVPSKRKAAPKKKKEQNGLFADEELASDDEDDLWDEEALREAAEMALQGENKNKPSVTTTAGETKKKELAPAPKKAAAPAAAPAKKLGAGSSTTSGGKAGPSKPAQQKGIGSFFTKKT